MSGKKLVIAAAGTGGHVMPGLAVAREMRRRGWDIEWIGTQTGMEGGLVGRDDIVFTGWISAACAAAVSRAWFRAPSSL